MSASDLAPAAPSVACPTTGQTGPVNTGRGSTKRAASSAPDAPVAPGALAYYRAEQGYGVYAPQGWQCRAWFGSNGNVLVVTPRRIDPPYVPLPVIAGPAVTIQSWDSQSSGRFHVAIVAAQLFPLVGEEFIARVRQEHLIADSSFDVQPDPDDQLQYLSDRFVAFTTAPQRAGLGTDGVFEVSNLAVKGLIILHLEEPANALTEVRVRLPPGMNAVATSILQLEATCIQLRARCRGTQ